MSAPSASMEQTRALQRPHNTFALTGQCKKNDRTIRLQRPHDPTPTTARLSRIVCTLPEGSPDGFFPSPSTKIARQKPECYGLFKKRFGVSGSLRQKDTDDKKQYFSQKKKHFIWNLIFSFYICGKKQTKHSFMKTTMVNTFFWWRHLQPLRS